MYLIVLTLMNVKCALIHLIFSDVIVAKDVTHVVTVEIVQIVLNVTFVNFVLIVLIVLNVLD